MRNVEVNINGTWFYIGGLENLHKGDTFRMFEVDGEPVVGDNDKTEWKASSEPYWSDTYDSWMVDIETNVLH